MVEGRGRDRRIEESEERRVGRRSRLIALLEALLLERRRREVTEEGKERRGMLGLRLREIVRGMRVVRLGRRRK